MRCATPYRHDSPECGGTKAALIVEDDEVMNKDPSGRECRITVGELEGEYSDDPPVLCPECGDDAWRSVENDIVFYNHSDGRTCVLSAIQEDQRKEA